MNHPLQGGGQPTSENAVGTIPRGKPIATTGLIASENIEAKSFVHLWDNGATTMVRNANAFDLTRPARGYVTTPVSAGGLVTVYPAGSAIPDLANLPPGDYYLAETPGQITTSPPANKQYIGTATPSGFTFNPGEMTPPSAPVETGLISFEGRTDPAAVLTYNDVINALGYTPGTPGIVSAVAPLAVVSPGTVGIPAQAKNTFLAGPDTGANAVPTFRVIDFRDFPFTPAAWTSDTLVLGDFTSDFRLLIVGAAGTNRTINFHTGTAMPSTDRWIIFGANSDPETGANAGSNFGINAYDDTGTVLGTYLRIVRATGVIDLSGNPSLSASELLGTDAGKQVVSVPYPANFGQAVFFMGMDGEEGPEGMPIPGRDGTAGSAGAAGATGPQGPIGFGMDGADGQDGISIPGRDGAPGAKGVAGATGPQGPIGFGVDGMDGDDGSLPRVLSGSDLSIGALVNGMTATTQSAGDSSKKLATDEFVTTAINNAIAGVNPAVAVQAATTAAADTSGFTYNNGVSGIGATFTGSVNTAVTIDGYTFTALGQRLLVKNDTQSPSGAFNGIYYVTQIQTALLPPILTRALDYDQPSDINNTGAIPVVNGTVNGSTSWVLTSQVTTVGTDPLTYTQFTLNPTTIVTAAATLTNHGVVVGQGGRAVAGIGAGTAGQVLTSNGASADPTFQTPGTGSISPVPVCQGRLTLSSNMPVMTADVLNSTAIYYAPYQGNGATVWNGSSWVFYTFPQLTMNLDTTNQPISVVQDLFLYVSSGSLAIGAGPSWVNTATVTWTSASPGVCSWTGHGLAEGAPVIFTAGTSTPTGITAGTIYYVGRSPGTNSFSVATSIANAAAGTFVNTSSTGVGTQTGTNHTSVRGTGAGTTQIDITKGLWTNTNSITLTNGAGAGTAVSANQATYIGSFYTTAAGQTGAQFTPAAALGGSNNILGIWNAYNRVKVDALNADSTVSWTYGTTTWRPSNGSVLKRITYLDGLAQSPVDSFCTELQTATATAAIGLLKNSTNATPRVTGQCSSSSTAGVGFGVTSGDIWPPSLGLNYIQEVEEAFGTITMNGAQSSGRQTSWMSIRLET